MILSEDERDYIEETYGDEPEDLPDYEVVDAIRERREQNKTNYKSTHEIIDDYKEVIKKFGFEDQDIDFSNLTVDRALFLCSMMNEKLNDEEDDEQNGRR